MFQAVLLAAVIQPTVTPATRPIADMIADLGSEDFAKREQACRDLEKVGEIASKALVQATKSADREIAWRAKAILENLDEQKRQRYVRFGQAAWANRGSSPYGTPQSTTSPQNALPTLKEYRSTHYSSTSPYAPSAFPVLPRKGASR